MTINVSIAKQTSGLIVIKFYRDGFYQKKISVEPDEYAELEKTIVDRVKTAKVKKEIHIPEGPMDPAFGAVFDIVGPATILVVSK